MRVMNKYRIYHRHQDIGKQIEQLHRNEQLAIGIIDVGTLEQLENTIKWYISKMNNCLHVVLSEDRGNLLQFQKEYPDVTFIVFPSINSFGECVNAIADECFTNFFMIVRSDVEIIRFEGSYLINCLNKKDAPIAITPAIANSKKEIIPSLRAPKLEDNLIDPESYFPQMSTTQIFNTLYPFKGLGIYERAFFQRQRGFDLEINSNYYQFLDFGLKTYQLGKTIANSSAFIISFPQRLSIIEDRSPTDGLSKVHTRALGVKVFNGKILPNKFKGYFDKKTYNDEVKQRLINIVKKDFDTIISSWQYTIDEIDLKEENK